MADVKFSGLPAVTALATGDILPVVASSVTSKITWDNLCLSHLSGAAATPSIAYAADPNTGAYWVSAGIQALTCDGVEVARFSAVTGLTPQILLADGTAAKPAYAWTTDGGMGLYRAAANSMGFSTGGAVRMTFVTAGITLASGSTTITATGTNPLILTCGVTTGVGPALRFTNVNSFTGASAITQVGAALIHTVNQTSTTGFTACLIDTTQTAVGSGQQIALDCSIATVSKFSVAAKGAISFTPGTPAALANADADDYNASGFTDVTFVRLAGDAGGASAITGFVAPLAVPVGGVAAGQLKILVNVSANNVTIKHANAGSAAANRITTTTAADVVMTQNDCMILIYDSTSALWRQITTAA